VPLDAFPRLKRYLEERKTEISGRHVAQKTPSNWYRTIDRITPALAQQAKLLIPDIKGEAQVVFEGGRLYPHHNLYFIVSAEWDLHALQAVLLSGIARFFVSTYSTKMRGGYLRFQAQYLRRIRVPLWEKVSPEMRSVLKSAGESRDLVACNRAARELYGLTESEWNIVSGTAA
jgi:PAS domain-containing protein